MGNNKNKGFILGLDVGSVSISLVCIDPEGNLTDNRYILHHGDIRTTLDKLIRTYKPEQVLGIAAPSGKTPFHRQVRVYDTQVSLMEAISQLGLKVRSILHVGAERFFLMQLDQYGTYSQTSHSSSCAAGTGSFLDQQALRLNLEDTAHLSETALLNRGAVPEIAARCSVFAKTDLIHAQQKGYSLEAICDSLCKGLADNIADTLFNKSAPESPILMTGGVSLNRSVRKHLEHILGKDMETHSLSHQLPAFGAAMLLLEEIRGGKTMPPMDFSKILAGQGEKDYFFDALEVPRNYSTELKSEAFYEVIPCISNHKGKVQVDRVAVPLPGNVQFYLGIDVGSTSTKSVLCDKAGKVIAGFYTYTLGQPLCAVQAIFEAMDGLLSKHGIKPEFLGCGTTGSGRKFIGGIVGADQDVDEITAHAKAAFELNPSTDTIIEIGGQDAKFTQMKGGVVTFSHMNTVCAAGTGSFIEELAGRLGVQLKDYERLAMGRKAPLASDRCTVFMERDINQLLSLGYSVEEVLATVIHSVRENYLKKVASEAHIGEQICFQGATAKNKALVSAFEQRLGKPLFVSPLCHLTGALGTALILAEEHGGASKFRGLDLYEREIPVTTETCDLCLNRCTVSLARVKGEKLAYGFLCGRDYETRQYLKKEGGVFNLMRERKRLMERTLLMPGKSRGPQPSLGLPSTLHLAEDQAFWRLFFRELGIEIVNSEGFKDALKTGKKIAGAEFCAPIDAMYGQVAMLAERCDHIFMPLYLESRLSPGKNDQNFCYYTQFSGSLAFMEGKGIKGKLISPMLDFSKNGEGNGKILLRELRKAGFRDLKLPDILSALQKSREGAAQMKRDMEAQFLRDREDRDDISVVLLGRPYVVLSDILNKGIPGIFNRMGVRAYSQDMLKVDTERDMAFNRLLKKIPWHFASSIMGAAEQVCRTPDLYPVLITAFKCAPDSFILEYFKQLMNLYGKPYLVIQVDEHDSNTGYETRIEAALRSFRNHSRSAEILGEPDLGGLLPKVDMEIGQRTLLVPNWDSYVSPLIAANLRRAGYDARLLESSEMSIRKSMVHNTGQCLPINVIAQNFMDYIERHRLKPEKAILWMMESRGTCNIRQYPYYIKRILENYGKGMEKAAVYSGEITHRELSLGATYYGYFAYMLGGLFRKLACRIRPYEENHGQTDEVSEEVHQMLLEALSGSRSIDAAVREGVGMFEEVEYDRDDRKPRVAIFGDLYVRDNDIMNQDLIRSIEEAGGEALLTPYSEYARLTMENIFRRAIQRGERMETAKNRVILNLLKFMDERYYKPFARILGPAPVIKPRELEKRLTDFNIDLLHSGESYDNLLKVFYIMKNFPDVSLFVQTNPSFCCPALVTQAMTEKIRETTGVPVVTITYDGTSDRMNDVIVPYIRSAAISQ